MKRQDDEMLFERLLEGEGDKALRPLMERYGDALTLYANGYVHDIHAAEDLMIEAFFVVFPAAGRNHGLQPLHRL